MSTLLVILIILISYYIKMIIIDNKEAFDWIFKVIGITNGNI